MAIELQFYHVDTDYIKYLDPFQPHMWTNEEKGRKRPYIGLVLEIEGFKYYAPMSSPKPKHETIPEGLDLKKIVYKDELTGVININNIIPVKDTEIQLVDMDQLLIDDPKYCDLLDNQILVIRKRQEEITRDANLLYKIKAQNRKGHFGLKKRSYDFKLLEKKCEEYYK